MNTDETRTTSICPRDHLIRQLEEGLDCRVTLISAPEGYGKSTLLRTWSQATQCATAFVETDPDTPLLQSLIAAAAEICPDSVINLDRDQDPESQVIAILNQFACLDQTSALILDEYQPTPENDQILAFLAEYLPPQCHLYIASEDRLHLSLIPRLRVRRQLMELTTRDLQFDQREALELLAGAAGVALDSQEAQQLLEMTSGRAIDLRDFARKLRDSGDFDQCLDECPEAMNQRRAASSAPSRTKSPQVSANAPSVPIHHRTQ